MDQCRLGCDCEESPTTGPSLPAEERSMSQQHPHDDATAPVPWMQQLLDNPFLLLFLGVFVPMVLYTVWGVYDILTLPLAK
jgi:hypothetical protein